MSFVGENHTFDHIFCHLQTESGGQVNKLLSKQIIREDGSPGPNYALATHHYQDLLTGATGQKSRIPDQRIKNVTILPPRPFQLTSDTFPLIPTPLARYIAYQMWQQLDCNVDYATVSNAGGCKADLFPWVEVTVGPATNGKKPPSPFTETSMGKGGISMGFYNVLQGDVP